MAGPSKNAKAAKTAGSKNDPRNRDKARKFFFNGKEVIPVRFVGTGSYMAMADKTTSEMIYDQNKNPLPWGLANQA